MAAPGSVPQMPPGQPSTSSGSTVWGSLCQLGPKVTLAGPAGSHPASLCPATARKPPFYLLLVKWVKLPQAKINQQ